MDKLCIWMTLDQFPLFDSVNTLDTELSDDNITDFVNRILKEIFNKDLPKIIKHLYTKVSGGLNDEDPKSVLLSPKFKEKMMKSREKFIIPKPQKIQSITEKLKEESQSTNKIPGKSSFDRLFKDREVVIVKKESKRKSKKKSVKIKDPEPEPESSSEQKIKIKNKKLLLPLNEDDDEDVKVVFKPRKNSNTISASNISSLMLTPRKKRRNELLKNITKSPYKMSKWITNDKNNNLLPPKLNNNDSSDYIVFAPKTPSKKNKKSRNNVYFVGNDNEKLSEASAEKMSSHQSDFKVCQTPMVTKRSKSFIKDDKKGNKLVRRQSLLEELNSIAADDKENEPLNNNIINNSSKSNEKDKDTSLDSAQLEIKNLFEASFSQNNILNRSRSYKESFEHLYGNDKEEEEDDLYTMKNLYEDLLTNNSNSNSTASVESDSGGFNIFSSNKIHNGFPDLGNSFNRSRKISNSNSNTNSNSNSNNSSNNISFKKWLPKDINSDTTETKSISNEDKNDSPNHSIDDLEQLKNQYSGLGDRRFSFSPSPSPTPLSYSREISLSPTFNKINRNSSFTLGESNNRSFIDFSSIKEDLFENKINRRSSFINFNNRSFDLSSDSSAGGGSSIDRKNKNNSNSNRDSHSRSHSPKDDNNIFQKPWSTTNNKTSPPDEEIMKTPSKRKLRQSVKLPLFTLTSPSAKRKLRLFDTDDDENEKISPIHQDQDDRTQNQNQNQNQSQSQSHYLKVPILSTPKKRRINVLKVSDSKPSND
eukprot:jgi/Orpsp1_1/1184787/evm.model.c7180000090985.1